MYSDVVEKIEHLFLLQPEFILAGASKNFKLNFNQLKCSK